MKLTKQTITHFFAKKRTYILWLLFSVFMVIYTVLGSLNLAEHLTDQALFNPLFDPLTPAISTHEDIFKEKLNQGKLIQHSIGVALEASDSGVAEASAAASTQNNYQDEAIEYNPVVQNQMIIENLYVPDTTHYLNFLYRSQCTDLFSVCGYQRLSLFGLLVVSLILLSFAGYRTYKTKSFKVSSIPFVMSLATVLLLIGGLVFAMGTHFYLLRQAGLVKISSYIEQLKAHNDSDVMIFGSQDIAENIASDSAQLAIVTPGNDRELLHEILLIDSKGTFFDTRILPYMISTAFSDNTLDIEPLLLSNNRLIVDSFNHQDLQILLPKLSEHIIHTTYDSYSPNNPEPVDFSVLGSVEYQQFHEAEREKERQAIVDFMAELRSAIASINQLTTFNTAIIGEIDTELSTLEQDQKEYVEDLRNDYRNYCEQTGLQDREECKELQAVIDENEQKIQEYKHLLETSKQKAEQANREAENYKRTFQSDLAKLNELVELIDKTPVNTEGESGLFISEGLQIKIKYEDGIQAYDDLLPEDISEEEIKRWQITKDVYHLFETDKTFEEYVSTAVHEYLHYVTYTDLEHIWPRFLEEGMTEYLAVSAMANFVDSSQELGLMAYVDQVDFVHQLHQSENDRLLEQFFQDKSEDVLEGLLIEQYPDLDYEDFVLTGDALMFMGYDDLDTRQETRNELFEMVSK